MTDLFYLFLGVLVIVRILVRVQVVQTVVVLVLYKKEEIFGIWLNRKISGRDLAEL